MSEEDKSMNPTDENPNEVEKSQGQIKVPYGTVISEVVKKIRNEPFLFVIAIVALLIGLVLQATGLAAPELRFFIIVIAFLALVVILGNYILEAWRLYLKTQEQTSVEPKDRTTMQSPSGEKRITGIVKAQKISGDTHLGGVEATNNEVLKYEGEIHGGVDVETAEGGEAIGVKIGSRDDKDNPDSDNSS